MQIARHRVASGTDAARVAGELAHDLAAPELALMVVFADWRLDPHVLARELQAAAGSAPVVGCSTLGVIAPSARATDQPEAVAIGLYGDWLRVGIGVASELPKSALARSRDAVQAAAHGIGLAPEQLDAQRHVAITFVDGKCGHEEAFCIGSAASAPQIRFVGGSAATELRSERKSYVWARGEALADAGIVVVLDCARPFEAVTSSHLNASEVRTIVTAASGRVIDELDGRPAVERLREIAGAFDEAQPSEVSFARFVDSVPYVRSITRIEGKRIHLASAVEPGHVLRLMRPGDLIGQTRRDLARAAEAVGGKIAALFAFSCLGRHWDAAARHLDRELAAAYAEYPTVGFQSFGEQTGMLLVNHTLTGLAIG